MPRLPPRLAVLSLCALLVGCTTGGTGGADAPAVPAPAEAISVSALPPAGPAAIPAPAAPAPSPAPAAAGPAALAPAPSGEAAAPSGEAAAPSGEAAAPVEPPTATTAPPSPAVVLSAEERACQRSGGRYLGPGTGAPRACVRPTGEGAKRCTRETDCSGVCLARSGTCAPVTPLFGCNEILQADGRRVTLCLD